jgi:hypothetical protein
MKKWTYEFVEHGGYDCMTSAWIIRDELGNIVCTLDLADYGQVNCDYEFRSEEAEANAKEIAGLHP